MNDIESNYEEILIKDFDYLTEVLEASHDIFVKLTTNDASNAEGKLSTFEHYTQIVEVSMKIYHYHWNLNTGKRELSASPTLVNANTTFAWSAYDDAGQNMYTYGYMKWKSALATFAWAPIYRERYVRMEQNYTVDTTTPDNMVEEVIIGENAELEAPFLADPIQVIGAHDVARVGLWNIPISVINGKRNGNK